MSSLLVVDDHEANRFVITRILEDLQLDIIEADSGEAALAKLIKNDIFLILMDVNMPGMDGFETASLIHGQKKFNTIPIIFITGRQKEEISEHSGYASGAVDYLNKPVDPQALISKVKVFHELHQKTVELERQHHKISEQRKALEKNNEKLNQFTHTVAHDLKSPLATMISSIDLILQEGINTEESKKLLDIHQRTGTRMLDMIDELLTSASDLNNIEHHEVDLNEILNNVLTDLSSQIKVKQAKIDIQRLPKVLGSKTHLYQVFQNILSNSLKYSRENVPSEISISHILHETGHDQTRYTRIIIADNGSGFDPKLKTILFEPFHRLDNKEEGRGIGLSTVKRVMQEHGGDISAESELGVGSTFFLDFPILESPE